MRFAPSGELRELLRLEGDPRKTATRNIAASAIRYYEEQGLLAIDELERTVARLRTP